MGHQENRTPGIKPESVALSLKTCLEFQVTSHGYLFHLLISYPCHRKYVHPCYGWFISLINAGFSIARTSSLVSSDGVVAVEIRFHIVVTRFPIPSLVLSSKVVSRFPMLSFLSSRFPSIFLFSLPSSIFSSFSNIDGGLINMESFIYAGFCITIADVPSSLGIIWLSSVLLIRDGVSLKFPRDVFMGFALPSASSSRDEGRLSGGTLLEVVNTVSVVVRTRSWSFLSATILSVLACCFCFCCRCCCSF
mmetsp:Transcript_19810/g.34811  ORF Transcript_19810/g.34811 Transcript_19810/m.34811 type:complete len:249 (+) Transcript_19810:3-749(+)